MEVIYQMVQMFNGNHVFTCNFQYIFCVSFILTSTENIAYLLQQIILQILAYTNKSLKYSSRHMILVAVLRKVIK